MNKDNSIISISVCVPTYNGALYLAETLQSIVEQTYTDFEIIILDDLSSDSTVEICQSFADNDARIKLYLNEENLGLVGNWNKCLGLAKGEWIKFVFQDDVLRPTCLAQMASLIPHNRLIIASRDFIFDKSMGEDQREKYNQFNKELYVESMTSSLLIDAHGFSDILCLHPSVNIWGEPSSMLFKKAWVEDIGHFDKHLIQICDLEYWARIGSKWGACLLTERLLSFRVHVSSTTSKNLSQRSFYVNYLDYLYYYSKVAFDRVFQDFRHNASNWRVFKVELLEMVFKVNKILASTSESFPHTEIQKIAGIYPELATMLREPKSARLLLLRELAIHRPMWLLKDLKRRAKEKWINTFK